ncbi:MAG TPA: hypothetical protein VMB49_10765 [Acidobacteriaceae bacterium]|nr:hypothetical protein [Acidobacteriaceae bacterium]
MTQFGKCVLILGLLSGCVAIGQNAPAPRASAAAYPASMVQPPYSIGAKELSNTEVRNSFATPLAGRYIVVEIGFYPANSKTISLKQSDFVLRTSDGKDVLSPASPQTIASIYQKRPESSHDVTLYPTANVGYVSYPDYEGNGRRASGVVYGAGVGVAVDKNTSAATTDSDRQTMETELLDKELKDADVSNPVAGYLYFPIATKRKVEYQLEYRGTAAVSTLPLKSH